MLQVEQKIEDSLSTAVKQAVLQIAQSLVGDKKTEVPLLFHATLVLEKSQRLELKPTVQASTQPSNFWVLPPISSK